MNWDKDAKLSVSPFGRTSRDRTLDDLSPVATGKRTNATMAEGLSRLGDDDEEWEWENENGKDKHRHHHHHGSEDADDEQPLLSPINDAPGKEEAEEEDEDEAAAKPLDEKTIITQVTTSGDVKNSRNNFFRQYFGKLIDNKKKQAGLLLGFGLAIIIICASVGLGWRSRGFIAIAIFAVCFWTFEPAPVEYTSLFLLFLLQISTLMSFVDTWAGAASEATWLVFAGMAISLAINETTFSAQFARLFMWLGKGTLRLYACLAVLGAILTLIIPSGVVRVIVLMPVVSAIRESINEEFPTNMGVYFAAILSTLYCGTGVLTGMTPNIIVTASVDILWGQWAARMVLIYFFVEMGIVIAVTYLMYGPLRVRLSNISLDTPKASPEKKPPPAVTSKEVRVACILVLAFILWATDSLHKILPVQVGIGAVLLLYFPGWGPVHFRKIGNIKFPLLIFVIAVLALGKGINDDAELRDYLSKALKWWVERVDVEGVRYYLIVLIIVPFNFIMDSAAACAVVTPLFRDIADQLHLSQEMVALSVVMGAGIVFVPYQSVPFLIAFSFKKATLLQFIAMMTIISLLNLVIVVPLTIGWWFLIDVRDPFGSTGG
jgi:hypothetical protein